MFFIFFKVFCGGGEREEKETLAAQHEWKRIEPRECRDTLAIWQEARKGEGTASFPSLAWPQSGGASGPAPDSPRLL